jgi:hypothetical protein
MSTSETNRANLMELLNGLSTGRLMEVFDKFYADDIVMSENGSDDPSRHGKEKNRAYEAYFAAHAEWHGARLGPVLADGDHTAYGMWMDFTLNGQRITRDQWSVQTWRDGQIVHEAFYYKA